MDGSRRGSGYSVPVNKGARAGQTYNPFNPPAPGAGPGAYSMPQMAPYYVQAPNYYPHPMMGYGPPPPQPHMMSPYGGNMMVPANGMGQYGAVAGPSSLRRAGSINAKIMSQDAYRPFSNVNQHLRVGGPSSDVAIHPDGFGNVDDYAGVTKPMSEAGFDRGTADGEDPSVLEHLKRSNEVKQDSFVDKLKFWQATKPRQEDIDEQMKAAESTLNRSYNVRKTPLDAAEPQDRTGDDPTPYPGLIIEEIMDSASTHAGPTHEGAVPMQQPTPEMAVSVLGTDQFSAALPQRAPVRWKHTTPLNTVIMFVPQQEAWVVERMGKYNRILEPGMNVLAPVIDKVKYVQSLKEIAIDIPSQSAITIDNVNLNIDGILYLRIVDPYKASYGVEDPEFAITQLAQTTMRSEIGKITLDTLFRERENLNLAIVEVINQAADAWGITCLRYEIRDIRMPARVQEAMQMQVEAERKKRAAILESEGIKAAEINVAEGKKQARILQSEAEKQELINNAHGAAEAVVAAGNARARSIELVAKALDTENGHNAAGLAVAEKYVSAFQELARTNNTLILPANTGDAASMVTQAMAIYSTMQGKPGLSGPGGDGGGGGKHQPVLDPIGEVDPSELQARLQSMDLEAAAAAQESGVNTTTTTNN